MGEEVGLGFGSSSSESELDSMRLNLLLNLTACLGLSCSSRTSSVSFALLRVPLTRGTWALLGTTRLWMALL